ncbi:DUF3817 domain-containing protein [Poseidonibacter sp.]|uniref:DUF3817 domain-containing protein n=1 Tax=Poseidonibacter sp. TaxID=2321188 RepID=UPI003C790D04
MNTAFSRFRLISITEGISYLLLLFVAMPMKYLADNPYPVKVVGMGHGILFIFFTFVLFNAMIKYRWNIGIAFQLFVYSLLPFGFLLIEKVIKKLPQEENQK